MLFKCTCNGLQGNESIEWNINTVLNYSHLSVRFFYSGRVRGLIYYHAPQAIED